MLPGGARRLRLSPGRPGPRRAARSGSLAPDPAGSTRGGRAKPGDPAATVRLGGTCHWQAGPPRPRRPATEPECQTRHSGWHGVTGRRRRAGAHRPAGKSSCIKLFVSACQRVNPAVRLGARIRLGNPSHVPAPLVTFKFRDSDGDSLRRASGSASYNDYKGGKSQQ